MYVVLQIRGLNLFRPHVWKNTFVEIYAEMLLKPVLHCLGMEIIVLCTQFCVHLHPLKRRIFAIIDFLTDFLNIIFSILTGKLVILFSIFCYFFHPYTKILLLLCFSFWLWNRMAWHTWLRQFRMIWPVWRLSKKGWLGYYKDTNITKCSKLIFMQVPGVIYSTLYSIVM